MYAKNPSTTSSSTPKWARSSSKSCASSTQTKNSPSTSTLISCKPVRAQKRPSPKRWKNYLQSSPTSKRPFLSTWVMKTSPNTSTSASARKISPSPKKWWKTISGANKRLTRSLPKKKTLLKVFWCPKFIEASQSGKRRSWNSWLTCRSRRRLPRIPSLSSPRSSSCRMISRSLLMDDIFFNSFFI